MDHSVFLNYIREKNVKGKLQSRLEENRANRRSCRISAALKMRNVGILTPIVSPRAIKNSKAKASSKKDLKENSPSKTIKSNLPKSTKDSIKKPLFVEKDEGVKNRLLQFKKWKEEKQKRLIEEKNKAKPLFKVQHIETKSTFNLDTVYGTIKGKPVGSFSKVKNSRCVPVGEHKFKPPANVKPIEFTNMDSKKAALKKSDSTKIVQGRKLRSKDNLPSNSVDVVPPKKVDIKPKTLEAKKRGPKTKNLLAVPINKVDPKLKDDPKLKVDPQLSKLPVVVVSRLVSDTETVNQENARFSISSMHKKNRGRRLTKKIKGTTKDEEPEVLANIVQRQSMSPQENGKVIISSRQEKGKRGRPSKKNQEATDDENVEISDCKVPNESWTPQKNGKAVTSLIPEKAKRGRPSKKNKEMLKAENIEIPDNIVLTQDLSMNNKEEGKSRLEENRVKRRVSTIFATNPVVIIENTLELPKVELGLSSDGRRKTKQSILKNNNVMDDIEEEPLPKLKKTRRKSVLLNANEVNLRNSPLMDNNKNIDCSLSSAYSIDAQSSSDKDLTPDKREMPTYVSPFVTMSRGKENARREYYRRSILGEDKNQKSTSPKAAAMYFTKVITDHRKQLLSLCSKWSAYKSENEAEEVHDMINVAIGQTELLLNKKFKQFQDLIRMCETGEGEKPVLSLDLHGYYDTMNIQIVNLEKRFENLDQLKENNWEEIAPSPRKKTKVIVKKAPKKVTAKSSGLRAMIEAKRRQLAQQPTLGNDILKPAGKSKTGETPRRNSSRRVSELQLSTTKKRISSPGLLMMKATQAAKSAYSTPNNLLNSQPKSILKSDRKRNIRKSKMVLFESPNNDVSPLPCKTPTRKSQRFSCIWNVSD